MNDRLGPAGRNNQPVSLVSGRVIPLLILFFLLPWLLPSVRHLEIFLFVLWYIGRFVLPALVLLQIALIAAGIRSKHLVRLHSLQVISMTLVLLTLIRILAFRQ